MLDITVLKDGNEVGMKMFNPEAYDGPEDKCESVGGAAPPQPQYRPPPQTNAGN